MELTTDASLCSPVTDDELQVVEQRRKLPPVLNDKALFTKAAPFGDRTDQSYHAPSNRIGVYYSPCSMAAASMLLEEVPQVP
jgi:dynein heavy chain